MGKITTSETGGLDALLARVERLERQLRTVANSATLINDGAGNRLIGPDNTAGVGLGRPYLAVPFYDDGAITVPAATTTSATFVNLQAAKYVWQHQRLYLLLLARASVGDTTGEVQVTADGVLLGSPVGVGAGAYLIIEHTVTVPGYWGQVLDMHVQGRRTAGTGSIGVRVMGAYAMESEQE